jgi:O-methyltransferase
MDSTAQRQLIEKLTQEIAARHQPPSLAIVGKTPAALELSAALNSFGLGSALLGVYAENGTGVEMNGTRDAFPVAQLSQDAPDIVLIASDEYKEELITAAIPHLRPSTKILIGGFKHFRFSDPIFNRETLNPLIPSLANGYPNSLIHLFQCLQLAARLGLQGVVAEFGMFKGGTTMLLSRFIEGLGQHWRVYGFDTFDGFPAPRSPLDMYAHPDCVYLDLDAVRRVFASRNVEIVPGDVVETVQCLRDKDVVLAFVDTDNYTSAKTILDVIVDRVVVGGALVFDHFTGRDRHLYTLGERFAAKRLLSDARFFNLHDTGVFLKLR